MLEKIAVQRIIRILEECLLPAIAALGDMIGDAGDNEAGKTGHPQILPKLVYLVNWHRNCAP